MYEAIRGLLQGTEVPVVEAFQIPARSPRFGPIPKFLLGSPVGDHLQQRVGSGGLWTHQAEALEALGDGTNVVVSTGTASGKSLVFQAFALHKVLADPSSRAIVFYPLRALVEDQFQSWQEMARSLGLDDAVVGRIYGPTPRADREEILQTCRIIVMTPDVCQAWLMQRLAMPAIRDFLRSLSIVILDEAHTLEGVFGSNFAFLIRRLMAARNHLLGDESSRLQLVAATATIANPGEHMKRLTGTDFTVVDQESDGSPHHERLVAHVASAEGDELATARLLQSHALTEGVDGGFITFVDSRKGVETLAIATEQDVVDLVDNNAVVSYRAGFDPDDRRTIERQLRDGARRGVVSTSALELGIDFPHLRVGFNVGVPPTRKQYRQRLGRVGRRGPGAFVVVGPPDAFRRYGTSFVDYHGMPVEPSYLYLDNRFMQFAHGRCLSDELEALAAPPTLPTGMGWPSGFGGTYAAARPGGNRPLEFDAMARLGGDTPHLGYPLRNVGEVSFDIKFRENADRLGDASESQALRECYPGATYLHRMRPYEVTAWHASVNSPYVQVRNGARGRSTQPRIVTWINASISRGEVKAGHILRHENGFLVECDMLITERVEGYTDRRTGQFHSYRDLQEIDPRLRARSRNFRTTGIVFCIDEDWFKKGDVKRQFADRMREIFVHEYSILPRDVGSAATNVVVRDLDAKTWRGGCVAVFDQTYGSLRFTEKLYLEFRHVLERMRAASTVEPDGPLASIVPKVITRFEEFTGEGPFVGEQRKSAPDEYVQVFAEGSRVHYAERGTIGSDVEVIEPTLRDGELMYRVKAVQQPGRSEVRRWVRAAAVEPSADDTWEYAWWNRQTEVYEEPPDAGE